MSRCIYHRIFILPEFNTVQKFNTSPAYYLKELAMKNKNWIYNIAHKLGFKKKPRRKNKTENRKRNALGFESLEAKSMLTAVGFSSELGLLQLTADAGEANVVEVSNPSADSLQILVGNGDEITLQDDADLNADFVLSTTNTVNDTLTIDVGSSIIESFFVNLGDLDDVFTFLGADGAGAVTVNAGGGNDTVDGSAVSQDLLLLGGGGNDTLIGGSGNDTITGGGGTDIIDGGDGIDTNSFQGIGLGVSAVVNADGSGTASYGMVNETFVGIENLTGSENDDTLVATGAVANVLRGEGGDDVLAGGGGTDVIDGGAGIDTNSFQGIGLGVSAVVNADGSGTASYGAVNETFVGIENLTGSENDDTLVATGVAANVLRGEGGNDVLAGGGGTDVIDGGEGIDTNSFQGIGLGVSAVVNADGTGTAVYGAVSETFVGIENLTGSENDDTLVATGVAANVLRGEGGNDVLAGGGGTDVIDGGEGIDTNSFQGIGLGVFAVVNADGSGTAIYGMVDETFSGIENLTGSENDDTLVATGAVANVLRGEGGDDVLAGGGGTDVIDGGEGIDTNSFQGIGLGVTAIVNADGTGTADYGAVNETFVGIENLTGSENDDTLIAIGAAANVLRGEGGNDVLAGGGGTDVIDGGEGIDTNSFIGIGTAVTAVINEDGSGTAVYGPVNEVFTGIENLTGSDNDDTLTGNSQVNVLDGGLGNDNLNGLGGDDLLLGSGGDDVINGGSGNDELLGGTGNDILRGASGNDQLTGEDGNDTLNGGGGNDTLSGNEGNDLIVGGGGTDIIDGGAGIDINSFQGIGLGVDVVLNADGTGTADYGMVNETFAGIENLVGSENDDSLRAVGIANNVIQGAGGNDVISGGGGDDTLVGNDGDDTLRGGSGGDVILGGFGNDISNGGGGNDILLGGEGDDFFVGVGGTDFINGGDGFDTNSFQGIGAGVFAVINDDGSGLAQYGVINETFLGVEQLVGSENDDVLVVSGSRNTSLFGLGGDDVLIGGSGEDTLVGGIGDDTINGLAGNDLLFGEAGNDLLNGGDGDDFARGDGGDDTINGGNGVDTLEGSDGNDLIAGNAALDFLFGGLGDDELLGGSGDDEIRGEEGDDLLIGGLGEDLLIGGPGEDTEIQ